MSWRRASTVLAMLAALVMAPSSVSAAKPNELLSASVVPTSGTVSTPFVLSVRYVSEAGNPATAVTATVAAQTILMANTSGTALDGTWTAVTQLPAGSWTVTYTAVVAKGPVPTVRSGTISVAQSSAPNPVESAGASSREPSPSRGAQPSAPTSNTSPGAEPVSSAGAVANPSADNGGVEPLATPDGAAGPAGRGAVPSGGGGGATAGSDDPSSPDLLNMVLLLGIVGVAAVALVGVGWIAITGRRNDPEASLADARIGADPAVRAIPTVEQRAIRRARLNQSNDPILAALGLPDNDPPPPAADELEGRRPRGKKRAER
jgi:hypothetical protein